MNGCDVLLTYCWNRVGYTILRSLSSKGLRVWTADTSKINICSVSRYCTGSFQYPSPFLAEQQFIDCLVEKVRELQPRILIPTHEESVIIMRHRDAFPADLLIPYSNATLLSQLSDKEWTFNKAKSLGIPVPWTYASADDVTEYPCVFKKASGNSAKGVFYPKDRKELDHLMEVNAGSKYIIQKRIGGSDYSVDCIRWDGYFQSSVYRAIITKTYGGGTTTQREMVDVPELEKYARTLLDAVGYKGVCGLDFRFNPETGEVAFIEVNARFTGGIATPVAAGFDIPWVLYSLATGDSRPEPVTVKTGVKTKWILGDLITLVGRIVHWEGDWNETRKTFQFRGFAAFDDFRWDDWKAFFGELRYYFIKLTRNWKLNP